jgi:hypothetical protein
MEVTHLKLLAQYIIPLNPRPKKNEHRIGGSGPKCPVCKKYKKQFVRNGSKTTEFAFEAARFLQPRQAKPIPGPVRLVYRCFRETKHRVDDLNLYEALDDLLVKEGVLADDNINIIRSRDGSRCFYDKENPRAEIYIFEYNEEEDREHNKDIYSGPVSGAE